MARVNILIIDDERKYHHQFRRLLEEDKYNVVFSTTGETALKKLHTTDFDLIILDMVLKHGKMTGLETLDKINRINPNILIALTSAYVDVNLISKAISRKKAHTYINKPLNKEELTQTIKSATRWKKISPKIANDNISTIIQLHDQSIMKRCFLTDSLYCPLGIEEDTKLVFVGMPFNEEQLDEIYQKSIIPAVEAVHFKIWRADDELNPIDMFCKICQKIQAAKYCIFVLTTLNPNVIFELGIALGLAKRCILMKSEDTEIPSNLKGIQYIEYDGNNNRLKDDIHKYFSRILIEGPLQKGGGIDETT